MPLPRVPSHPDVHVAVVNWNTARSALTCAAAYADSRSVRVRVTIVDNASVPSEQELLRKVLGDRVELQIEPRNLGYGAAVNRVLLDTDATFVCASNADVRPDPDALARLAEVALSDQRAGLVAPRLIGSATRYHARLPHPLSLPPRAFLGSLGHRTVADPSPGAVSTVEQPAGACLLARREVWNELGGFDAGFFLWYEDVDLARRSLNAGYHNLVIGSASAEHVGGEAASLLNGPTQQAHRLRSLKRYSAKHHPHTRLATSVAVAVARPLRARSIR